MSKAFLLRGHLVALSAGCALAVWSERLDVMLPLILAAETTYLRVLGRWKRFRRWVDAVEVAVEEERMLRALGAAKRERHDRLSAECLELRAVARELSPGDTVDGASFDRLLTIHVRLLFAEQALERFLSHAPEGQLRKDVKSLDELPPDNPVVRDSLELARSRLANYHRAREKHARLGLQLQRVELLMRSICERGAGEAELEGTIAELDLI